MSHSAVGVFHSNINSVGASCVENRKFITKQHDFNENISQSALNNIAKFVSSYRENPISHDSHHKELFKQWIKDVVRYGGARKNSVCLSYLQELSNLATLNEEENFASMQSFYHAEFKKNQDIICSEKELTSKPVP